MRLKDRCRCCYCYFYVDRFKSTVVVKAPVSFLFKNFFYLKSKFRLEVRFPARLPPGSAVALGRFPPGNVGSRWAGGGTAGLALPGLAKGLLLSPPNLAGKLNECLLEFLFDSITFHYVPRAGVGRGEDTRPAPGTLHAGPALRPIRGCPRTLPTSSYSHG